MRIREWIILAGWAALVGGLFVALHVGHALMAAGALTLVLGIFVMEDGE